jgi:hypothetical protein
MHLMRLARRVIHAGVLIALLGGSVHAELHILPVPPRSLSESVSQSDAVCLAKWVSSSTPDDAGYRDVRLEVVAILKSPPRTVRTGDRFDFRFSASEAKRGLFLLFGKHDPSRRDIGWDAPQETTRACLDYITQAPAYADQPRKLLPYLMQVVDTPDRHIRADLVDEIQDAHVADLRAIISATPRDKLRKRLVGPDTPDELPGLCCYLLGLSGTGSSGTAFSTGDDVKLLEAKVREQNRDGGYRTGADYMMIGNLLLAGDPGLDRVDAWRIKDRSAPFGETYGAMQALRFLWKNGNGKITHDRLLQSMRLFLDRPELADLAIEDLRRWQDWNHSIASPACMAKAHSMCRASNGLSFAISTRALRCARHFARGRFLSTLELGHCDDGRGSCRPRNG